MLSSRGLSSSVTLGKVMVTVSSTCAPQCPGWQVLYIYPSDGTCSFHDIEHTAPKHVNCPNKGLNTLRTPWSNCYRTATASELIWLRRNVTGGRFSNLYQRVYFAYTNLANHRRCTKLFPRWQWRGRSRCGLGLLQNTQEFLLPVGTHASISRLLTHTASSASIW